MKIFHSAPLLLVAVVVLGTCIPAYATDQPELNDLERLFTTPYERAQLDAMRRRGARPDEQQDTQVQSALPPLQVEVKGLVVRKNAPNVVWVNKDSTLKGKNINERILF